MPRRVNRCSPALLAVALALATPAASGCGYHGLIDGNWTPLHPKSLAVAIAVRAAADGGIVDASQFAARAAGPLGYLRATKHLRELRLTFGGNPGTSGPWMQGIAVVFVESGLWTRYISTPQGIAISVHVQGPDPDDAVVVTSEAVVAALLSGRLPVRLAINLGLIAFDGATPAAREAARALFLSIGPDTAQSPMPLLSAKE